jgi:hypothetical protein
MARKKDSQRETRIDIDQASQQTDVISTARRDAYNSRRKMRLSAGPHSAFQRGIYLPSRRQEQRLPTNRHIIGRNPWHRDR